MWLRRNHIGCIITETEEINDGLKNRSFLLLGIKQTKKETRICIVCLPWQQSESWCYGTYDFICCNLSELQFCSYADNGEFQQEYKRLSGHTNEMIRFRHHSIPTEGFTFLASIGAMRHDFTKMGRKRKCKRNCFRACFASSIAQIHASLKEELQVCICRNFLTACKNAESLIIKGLRHVAIENHSPKLIYNSKSRFHLC